MKKALILLVSLGLITGCGKDRKKHTAGQTETRVETVVDSHNAQNSLDYTGTYNGILPCADCSGIKTEITLNPDNTYKITTEYIDKGEGEQFVDTGKYAWDNKGNIISLHSNRAHDEVHTLKYMVQENQLVQLDLDGNKIETDLASHYILHKKHQ